jgi:hypothetical protein
MANHETILPVCANEHGHLRERIKSTKVEMREHRAETNSKLSDLEKAVSRLRLWIVIAAALGGTGGNLLSQLLK